MGCGDSKPAVQTPTKGDAAPVEAALPDRAEAAKSHQIEKDLAKARKQEKKKFKLLLLGAGESGKSTILKQMRILHGLPWDDDELRMYGVVVRSNAIVAVKKLCLLIGRRNLVEKLAEEPENAVFGMTPKAAYDDVCSYVIKREVPPPQEFPEESKDDWVGDSPRAGIGPNVEATLFLHKWKEMKCIWEVRGLFWSSWFQSKDPTAQISHQRRIPPNVPCVCVFFYVFMFCSPLRQRKYGNIEHPSILSTVIKSTWIP
jgi:hypothetical protein